MKKLFILVLLVSLITLWGCNSGANETTPSITATESTIMEMTSEEIYDSLLSKLVKKLNNIILDDTHLDGFNTQEGMSGIAEITITGDTDLLKKFGYTVVDINEDDIDELLICQADEMTDNTCSGAKILCAYTISDNESVLLFEGNSENCYYFLGNGKFYKETPAGDCAVYILEAKNTALTSGNLIGDEANSVQKIELTSLDVFHNIKIAENS